MNAILGTSIFLAFCSYCLIQLYTSKKQTALLALNQFQAQLDRRYDLIEDLLKIVKIYKPDIGVMLEKVVKIRLAQAKKNNFKVSNEVHQEVFEMLDELLSSQAYEKGYNLSCRLIHVEANIRSAHNYYRSSANDFNSFARVLFIRELEIYNGPELQKESEVVEERGSSKVRQLVSVG